MNKEVLEKACTEISYFKDKFGEVFFEAVMEDTNSTNEMSKSMISVFEGCKTENEFKIANSMLIAVCGYSFESLVERIKKYDKDGYVWESIDDDEYYRSALNTDS